MEKFISEINQNYFFFSACDRAAAAPNHISILPDQPECTQTPQNHCHTTTLSLNTGSERYLEGRITSRKKLLNTLKPSI